MWSPVPNGRVDFGRAVERRVIDHGVDPSQDVGPDRVPDRRDLSEILEKTIGNANQSRGLNRHPRLPRLKSQAGYLDLRVAHQLVGEHVELKELGDENEEARVVGRRVLDEVLVGLKMQPMLAVVATVGDGLEQQAQHLAVPN